MRFKLIITKAADCLQCNFATKSTNRLTCQTDPIRQARTDSWHSVSKAERKQRICGRETVQVVAKE